MPKDEQMETCIFIIIFTILIFHITLYLVILYIFILRTVEFTVVIIGVWDLFILGDTHFFPFCPNLAWISPPLRGVVNLCTLLLPARPKLYILLSQYRGRGTWDATSYTRHNLSTRKKKRSCLNLCLNRPYAYDVTEGRPAALGVKRNTATCIIAKHAARGANPTSHTAGLARPGPRTERLSANAHCQHNTCALPDTRLASLLWRCDPLWHQCIRSILPKFAHYSGTSL